MRAWVVLGVVLMACGDDARDKDADSIDVSDGADGADGADRDGDDDVPDAIDTTDPTDASEEADGADRDDGDATDPIDTLEEADGDDVPDTSDSSDGADGDAGPARACGPLEACDQLLDADGLCPGGCHSTDGSLDCADGVVQNAVCNALTPIPGLIETVDFGDFRVIPKDVPPHLTVGDSADFALTLVNDSDHALDLPFRLKSPDVFLIEGASWQGVESWHLEPRASLDLTARITALKPTLLSGGSSIVASFIFGDDAVYEPRVTVHFLPSEPIACGGEHFPETWCPDEHCYESRGFYNSARCCGDVFFPGAVCCDDTDCGDDVCVDGKCVPDAPWLGSANNAAIGHQTIRLVLVDSHPQFVDPCADHFADVQGEIDFAAVQRWYDDLAQRRLGRDAVDFRWIVTGGVATSDFLTGSNAWDDYSRDLQVWLAQAGCPIFDGDGNAAADKIIISSSNIELYGFGGYYMDRGRIAVFAPYNGYLLAHELAHSFGATDLYLDLAGPYLYPLELMGNWLATPPEPGDKVAWGELGFADVDRSGVLDVVELATFPESLGIAHATAVITKKNTVELRWEFVAREPVAPAGPVVDKLVLVPRFHVRVPAAGADFDQQWSGRWKTLTYDGTQVDLAALRAAGEIELALTARYGFTDRDWVYRTLTLDESYRIPITIEE